MWAGAGGPPQWTQWALNPSAYQGMSNDKVDWARLAQQWIMMKETDTPGEPTGPPGVTALTLPPPPEKHHVVEEGGVADMDIGKDEDEGETQPPAEGSGFTDQWGNWQQWGGYNTWPPGTANSMPGMTKNGSDSVTSAYPYAGGAAGYDYNNSRANNYSQGYWPDSSLGGQMPFVRGGQFRSGQTWDSKNKRDFTHLTEEDDESEPVIDAAKRRTLPIWIREGLEKMEREKQKQLEKEQMEKQREEMMKQQRLKEQEALNEIQAERGLPPKSKFDSDSEERASEDEDRIPSAPSPPSFKVDTIKRKSRFHDGPLGMDMRSASPPKLTKDELMLKVRRTMTEVLLAVTTDEIKSVVRDTLMKARRKAPAKQDPQKKTMAVASLKGSLGLAMYGSGSEGSDSDSEDDGGGQQRKNNDSQSEYDSDVNLKDEIRRRQQDFIVQEREIEAQAAEAEQREKQGGGRGGKEGLDHQQGTSGGDPKRQVESESAIGNPDGSGDRKKRHEKDEVIDYSNNDKPLEKNDKIPINHNKTKSDKKNKSSSDESSESSRSSKRKHKKKTKEKKRDKKDRKQKDDNSDTSTSRRSKKRERSTSRHREDRKRRDRSRSRSRRRDRSRSKDRSRRDRSDSRAKQDRSRRDVSESRSRKSRSPRRSRRSRSDSRSRRGRSRSGSPRRNRRRRSSSYSSSGSDRYRRKRSRR